jgi:hypothetical protein
MNSAINTFAVPAEWPPIHETPTEAFPKWSQTYIAFAVRKGWHHDLFSPAEFQQHFAGQMRTPTTHPGPVPSLKSDYPIYSDQLKHYNSTCTEQQNFVTATLASFSPEVLAVHINPTNPHLGTALATLSSVYYNNLAAFGTPLPSDLENWRAKLKVTHDARDSITKTILIHERMHLNFFGAQQPLSEHEKVTLLRDAIVPTGQFQFTLKAFTRQYPKVADQKFSNLAKELKDDETNRTVEATSQSQGYAAATVATAPPTLSADIHTLIVAAVREAIEQQRPELYCWTHGVGNHNSKYCRSPADGHQVTATAANKMGGNALKWNSKKRNNKKP